MVLILLSAGFQRAVLSPQGREGLVCFFLAGFGAAVINL